MKCGYNAVFITSNVTNQYIKSFNGLITFLQTHTTGLVEEYSEPNGEKNPIKRPTPLDPQLNYQGNYHPRHPRVLQLVAWSIFSIASGNTVFVSR